MGTEFIKEENIWGTWEELLLGGAVIRHGTRDWNLIAAELRARTTFPHAYTPEVCRGRYKDIQQRYPGCNSWFEKLRNQRIAELRCAVQQSGELIQTLECKLKSLRAQEGNDNHLASGQAESSMPSQKSERVESCSREMSMEVKSADSSTQERGANQSAVCRNRTLGRRKPRKPKASCSAAQGYNPNTDPLINSLRQICGVIVTKKGGKRKRKDFNRSNARQSKKESSLLRSTNKATDLSPIASSTNNTQIPKSSEIDFRHEIVKNKVNVLTGFVDSGVENKSSSVFHRRLRRKVVA